MLGISDYNLQCLGLAFIIGVAVYFLYKALKVNNSIIEGLQPIDKKIPTSLPDKIKLIEENLDIDARKSELEETLTNLSDFIKYGKIHTLLNYTEGEMGRR